MAHATLCEQYEEGTSSFGNSLDAGRYYAAVTVDMLPAQLRGEGHVITRGHAVGFGQWFFFDAMAPAVAFGRAARMSDDCSGYGVVEAAHETIYCHRHRRDERVLLLGRRGEVDRSDDELQLQMLKRFVQGVKEHPWSSRWREPTGYSTDYNGGRPIQTSQKSLPL